MKRQDLRENILVKLLEFKNKIFFNIFIKGSKNSSQRKENKLPHIFYSNGLCQQRKHESKTLSNQTDTQL